MSEYQEIVELLSKISRAEKAQVLQTVAQDLGEAFPGIDSNPNVCGGEPCIVRTRIPVWVLENARLHGLNEISILQNFPTLRAEDLAQAWAYIRSHKDEITKQIKENEAD